MSNAITNGSDNCSCCCCCNFCLLLCCGNGETGQYDCFKMMWSVLTCSQTCDKQCLQYTLCDDGSSHVCRCTYYTALVCGCHCCLPKCYECHQVKPLESGMCFDCWHELIVGFDEKMNDLDKMMDDLIQKRKTFNATHTNATNNTNNTNSTENDQPQKPFISSQPFSQELILMKYNITDKQSAQRWIIRNHPDKNPNNPNFDLNEFKQIINYYKSQAI